MKKVIRILAVVAVFALIFVALITNSKKKPDFDTAIWNKNMILGDPETAVRHYIVYTDLMCPYCNFYAKAIMEGDTEFTDFLSEHKILYEVRMTDMLYEANGVELSRPAAIAAYCAADQGRFWDFYHEAIYQLFTNYYSRGIGDSKTSPMIEDMTNKFWVNAAKEGGLDRDTFSSCLEKEKPLAQ